MVQITEQDKGEALHTPNWLNKELFHDILLKNEPNYAKVVNLTSEMAIPPGENFLSVMLRVYVDLDLKDGSRQQNVYVVKTMLDDENGGEDVKKLNVFPKELDMYRKYIPAFEAMYKARGWNVHLAPSCLHIHRNGDQINFIFEDLKMRGFENIDRRQGCNMNEMTRVLEKLAELHAASAVYAEQVEPYPEKFKYGFVHKTDGYKVQKELYNNRVNAYKKALTLWGLENADKYVAAFPTFDQYWKCIESNLNTDGNIFNVLNHGDLWSTNIMTTHNPNGLVDEVLLIDFQLCKWGSPAEDLHFIITTSTQKDIRIKEYDHFVAIYHEHLIRCLKFLGYKKPIPKLRELQMDMFNETNTFPVFYSLFNHLMVILLPAEKDSNFAVLMGSTEESHKFRMRALQNPSVADIMRDFWPFF